MKRFMTLFQIEFKLGLRCPDQIIFGVVMPLGVLALIAIIAGDQSVNGASYTWLDSAFASLITIGICATAFMGIPLTLADYRDKNILKHFFVTPIRPSVLLWVEVLVAMVTAVVSAILIALCAVIFFDYQMVGNPIYFILAWVLVLVSMYSIGMVIASVCSSIKVANIVTSLVYFPMLFLSGATIPIELFPQFLRNIAHVLPLTQGVELLKRISLGIYDSEMMMSCLLLAGIAIIGSLISVKIFRWM